MPAWNATSDYTTTAGPTAVLIGKPRTSFTLKRCDYPGQLKPRAGIWNQRGRVLKGTHLFIGMALILLIFPTPKNQPVLRAELGRNELDDLDER